MDKSSQEKISTTIEMLQKLGVNNDRLIKAFESIQAEQNPSTAQEVADAIFELDQFLSLARVDLLFTAVMFEMEGELSGVQVEGSQPGESLSSVLKRKREEVENWFNNIAHQAFGLAKHQEEVAKKKLH